MLGDCNVLLVVSRVKIEVHSYEKVWWSFGRLQSLRRMCIIEE